MAKVASHQLKMKTLVLCVLLWCCGKRELKGEKWGNKLWQMKTGKWEVRSKVNQMLWGISLLLCRKMTVR